MPVRLELQEISLVAGGRPVLDAVSLEVAPGSLLALTGASGAGKTTLLRVINRLVEPDSGRLLVDGVEARGEPVAALRRRIGYAAQGVGLFPHWTVADNIAAVPWLMGMPRANRREVVAEMLELVELPQDFAQRMPAALSGGQASRVGLARALAARPGLLLLDEPFAALDPETRDALASRIEALHRARGLTTIIVTHDLADALTRVDRILVMEAGRLVADGRPAELVRDARPAVQALVRGPVALARRLAALAGPADG